MCKPAGKMSRHVLTDSVCVCKPCGNMSQHVLKDSVRVCSCLCLGVHVYMYACINVCECVCVCVSQLVMCHAMCQQSQYRFLHEVVAEWLASRDSQLIKDDLAHGAQWTEEGQSSDQLPAAVREKFVHQFQVLY